MNADRTLLYDRHFATAAEALAAAIRTGVSDGAAIVGGLLATVAADLGSAHKITEKRPDSWEAEYLENLLARTVGADGEYLLAYRTRPIEVVECVPATLDELGIGGVYDDGYDLVDSAEAAMLGPDADEDARDAAYERISCAEELLDKLRLDDEGAYAKAFTEQVHTAAQRLVVSEHLPASIPVSVRFVGSDEATHTTGAKADLGGVEYRLWETARLGTPPPGFTEPLAHLTGDLETLLRRSHMLPHQRIPELAHYQARPSDEKE